MLQNKKLIQVVVSGILALLFVNFYLRSREQNIDNTYALVTVLVAARDIPPKTAVTADDFTMRDVPLKFLEPGAVLVKYPGQQLDRVKNKVTIAATPEGAQIMQTNLTFPNAATTGIAPVIPPGKRGVILRLGNLDVAQLILPGDHIDVLATFTVKDKAGEAESKAASTILQNVLVVSVGKDIRPQNQTTSDKKDTTDSLMLTLALSPLEAEQLSLAQAEAQGEISVIVRRGGDTKITPVPPVTPGSLLGH